MSRTLDFTCSDHTGRCYHLRLLDFKESTPVVDKEEELLISQLKYIWRQYLPRAWRYWMGVHVFAALIRPIGLTNWALGNKILHLCIHEWPVQDFSSTTEAAHYAYVWSVYLFQYFFPRYHPPFKKEYYSFFLEKFSFQIITCRQFGITLFLGLRLATLYWYNKTLHHGIISSFPSELGEPVRSYGDVLSMVNFLKRAHETVCFRVEHDSVVLR